MGLTSKVKSCHLLGSHSQNPSLHLKPQIYGWSMGLAHCPASSVWKLPAATTYATLIAVRNSVLIKDTQETSLSFFFKLDFLGTWGPLDFMHRSQTPKCRQASYQVYKRASWVRWAFSGLLHHLFLKKYFEGLHRAELGDYIGQWQSSWAQPLCCYEDMPQGGWRHRSLEFSQKMKFIVLTSPVLGCRSYF